MAKLTARGRKELARVSKEALVTDPERHVDWERTTIALMSDGAVLRKYDVRFRSDGKRHSYGWTKRGKAKAGVTPEQFVAAYEQAGYKRED